MTLLKRRRKDCAIKDLSSILCLTLSLGFLSPAKDHSGECVCTIIRLVGVTRTLIQYNKVAVFLSDYQRNTRVRRKERITKTQ